MDELRPRSRAAAVLLALTVLLSGPRWAAAQQTMAAGAWFPEERYFTPLLADPREIRLAAGLIRTDLFDPRHAIRERPAFTFPHPRDIERDLHGAVALGGAIPLWRSRPWRGGGITIGAQAGVFARFRLEEPSRDYVASDWMVALPVELREDRFSGRIRMLHRSSHLGDELILDTGAERIEFGHEAVDLVAAYRVLDTARIYGGGAFIFRSNTENEPLLRRLGVRIRDNAALQAGADGTWYLGAEERLGVVAGVDWQSAERTGWRSQLSAVAGLAARGPGGGLRLVIRYFDGTSPLGEFFLTDESFWGIEVTATP